MKNLKITFVIMMFTTFGYTVQAQQTNVGQALSGLINVSVGSIEVGDITVVDADNVLNNNEVRILNNVLNNSPIASNNSEILTNLLRDSNVISDNETVVGVLSGGLVLVD